MSIDKLVDEVIGRFLRLFGMALFLDATWKLFEGISLGKLDIAVKLPQEAELALSSVAIFVALIAVWMQIYSVGMVVANLVWTIFPHSLLDSRLLIVLLAKSLLVIVAVIAVLATVLIMLAAISEGWSFE